MFSSYGIFLVHTVYCPSLYSNFRKYGHLTAVVISLVLHRLCDRFVHIDQGCLTDTEAIVPQCEVSSPRACVYSGQYLTRTKYEKGKACLVNVSLDYCCCLSVLCRKWRQCWHHDNFRFSVGFGKYLTQPNSSAKYWWYKAWVPLKLLRSDGACMHQRTRLSLAQIMVCRLFGVKLLPDPVGSSHLLSL